MDSKEDFGAIYRRVVQINVVQLLFLFLGAACTLAVLQFQRQPYERFVPIPSSDGGGGVALDTKTGRLCITIPVERYRESDQELLKKGGAPPFCYDLYKENK